MQRCWRSAPRRWRSARRRSRSAARGSWSWLSPAVGLALLCAVCWGTVRLRGRRGHLRDSSCRCSSSPRSSTSGDELEGAGEALRAGWPVALVALLAASLPFAVEGHFGILGTSFNPDMSQHLLAADRLADGDGRAAAAPGLSARAARDRRRPEQGARDRPGPGLQRPHRRRRDSRSADGPRRLRRAAGRLRAPPAPSSSASPTSSPPTSPRAPSRRRSRPSSSSPSSSPCASRPVTWRELPLRFVPAALIAVGSVYVYSFPGLIWLIGTAVLWVLLEYVFSRMRTRRRERRGEGVRERSQFAPPAGPPAPRLPSPGPPSFWRPSPSSS